MIDLILGDCIAEMQKMESNIIDLTVTSPPYDNLRTYAGTLEWSFEIFQKVANELYRITKDGGVVVWVVGDATIKGSETGTSFRQALYFKDIGFNLHDTMIWKKPDAKPLTHNRYEQSFEYMFVFSKGKPQKFNGIKDKPNKHAGTKEHGTWRDSSGMMHVKNGHNRKTIAEFGLRHNIFECVSVKQNSFNHPAPFPEQLANDHIISWSNEGDLVFDPFMGSGTTGKMAKLNNRKFIGIEKVEEYYKIAKNRIEST